MTRLSRGAVSHNRVQAEPVQDPRGRIAFVETYNRRGDVWLTEAASWPRQVTTAPAASPGGAYRGGLLCWLPDGTGLVFVGEDDQLWRISDVGGEAVRLTDLPGRAAAPTVSSAGLRVAFVYSTENRQDVVTARLADKQVTEGELITVSRADFAFDPDWAPDGSMLAWHEWDVPSMPWDEGRIVVARPDGTGRRVIDGDEWPVAQPRFSPDGRWLAYVSERTGWLNLWIADTSTWTPRHLVHEPAEHAVPGWRPRVRTHAWAPDGSSILFVRSHDGVGSLARVEVDGGEVSDPGGPVGHLWDLSWGVRPVLMAGASDRPTALVELEESGRPAVLADDGLAVWEAFSPVRAEPVTFRGADDEPVHGMLWRPGKRARVPMLLYCHGGPNGQVGDRWNPLFQYWVERGVAVLAVDYRGSTGYGREYRDALLGRWGDLDVEDCAAGARWAVAAGVAEPDQIVPWGGSAGGFTVLLLLARHPDLFAGGIDLFGVTDLEHLARNTHRFEAHYLDRLVGPLPEASQTYRERSPLSLADRIDRPVLILQGELDEAVPLEQSRSIYERLLERGVDAELVIFEGEGHGFATVATLIESVRRMESFLTRLGVLPEGGAG